MLEHASTRSQATPSRSLFRFGGLRSAFHLTLAKRFETTADQADRLNQITQELNEAISLIELS